MAYADFTFYGSSYFGDTLTEETAPKWLERASDELDAITFGRLTFAFPTVEAHAAKVKKAVCAIAEALYWIDVQRRASSAQKAEDGSYHGAVASISSGRESISYSAGSANSSVGSTSSGGHLPRRKRRTEAITGLSRLSRPDGNPFPIRRAARTAPFMLPPRQAQRHKQF